MISLSNQGWVKLNILEIVKVILVGVGEKARSRQIFVFRFGFFLILRPHKIFSFVSRISLKNDFCVWKASFILSVHVNVWLCKTNLYSLILKELLLYSFLVLISLTNNFKSISHQTFFKCFVLIIGHIKHARQEFLLYVNQREEKHENFWEKELESCSKSVPIIFGKAQQIRIQPFLVIY